MSKKINERRKPLKRPYNHYDGYDELPDKYDKYDKLDSFKDFDYKGYDVKKKRKADSQLMKAWKKIKQAASSQDLKIAVGILLAVAVLLDKDRKIISALKDAFSGRIDFDTLGDMRDWVMGMFGKVAEGSSRRFR